jgi:hypothetical protein
MNSDKANFMCKDTSTVSMGNNEILIEVAVNVVGLPVNNKQEIEIYHDFVDEMSELAIIGIETGTIKFLEITEEEKKEDAGLIEPVDMLKNEYAEKCFQQYSNGEPQKWFYKNCGAYEENVVVIWWDDEDNRYRTSAEHRSELKTLNSHVKCKLIDKSEMPVDLP